MGCIETMLRKIVFLANFVFFLLGCVIIALGVNMYFTHKENTFDTLANIPLTSAIIGVIIIGSILASISFFGCCGPIMKNRTMMYIFGTLIIFLVLMEVAVVFTFWKYNDDIKDAVVSKMKEGLNEYQYSSKLEYDGRYGLLTLVWDTIQYKARCCGVEGPDDWMNTKFGTDSPSAVPDSCCEDFRSRIDIDNYTCWNPSLDVGSEDSSAYETGCLQRFEVFMKSHFEQAKAIGILLGALQLLSIMVSFYLGRQMGKADYVGYDLRARKRNTHSPSAPFYPSELCTPT